MLFSGPEEHAANPPETWKVVKVADRCWHLQSKDGVTLEYSIKRKRDAERLLTTGFCFDLWHKERRWFAGENVHPWKPWVDVKAERERTAAFIAARRAESSSEQETRHG